MFIVYKQRGEETLFTEYKFVASLPNGYVHNSDMDCSVVVAVKKDTPKSDHQIGLFELIKFFQSHKLMKKEFAEDILKINDIRNTFHFNKPRGQIVLDVKQVESSLDLLVKVIQRMPALIVKTI